jgi:hypothetical protein
MIDPTQVVISGDAPPDCGECGKPVTDAFARLDPRPPHDGRQKAPLHEQCYASIRYRMEREAEERRRHWAKVGPQLLAACEEIVRQANAGIDDADPENWSIAEITRPAIEAVAAAVAKAKGLVSP